VSLIVEGLLRFLADILVEPWRRKLQRKLGGRTLWAYLRDGRRFDKDELPPLPPKRDT
jgi:hypothetical protein